MPPVSEIPESDAGVETLRALSEFLGVDGDGQAATTSEILYSLMESGDPDALAFLTENPELCRMEYGEERVAAIMERTKSAVDGISES